MIIPVKLVNNHKEHTVLFSQAHYWFPHVTDLSKSMQQSSHSLSLFLVPLKSWLCCQKGLVYAKCQNIPSIQWQSLWKKLPSTQSTHMFHSNFTKEFSLSELNYQSLLKQVKYCTSLGKSSIIRKTLLNANPPFTYVYLQNLPNIYLSIYLIQFVQSLTPKSRTFINKHWIKLSEQNIHIKTSHIICGNIFDISTHRCSKTVEEIAKSPIPHLQQ